MKKIVFLIVLFSFICFTAESVKLPNIHKTASSSKVKKEATESSAVAKDAQQINLANLPDGKAYIGVNSYLSLRDEPFGKVVARLYNNEEVVIVNRDGDWYEVESDKGSGWIYGKCVFDSPNSNPNGSVSNANTDDDEDYEEDDDNVINKGNGTYNYFTFTEPGDYKFIFTASSDSNSQDTETTSDTSSKKTETASNTSSKKTKTTKNTTSKKSTTNTKKTAKNTDNKKSKSNSKSNTNIDKDDHLKAAQVWVDKVFAEILKYKCLHKAPKASRFEEIKKKKRISCTKSSSIVFQQAGMIPKGKIVGHTRNGLRGHSGDSFDKALKKSVTNPKYLIKGTCDIVMVMKPYGKCPKWLQQKGIYYIQESNACVSAGNGRIYSCNQTGKRYTRKSMFYRKSGYCMSRDILFAFVPRTNGKSNVPKNCGFKVKAAWGKGSSKIVDVK